MAWSRFVFFACCVVLLENGSFAQTTYRASDQPPVGQIKVLRQFGQLPLAFEANQGQARAEGKFLSHGVGASLFLTSHGAILDLGHPSESRSSTDVQNNIAQHEPLA